MAKLINWLSLDCGPVGELLAREEWDSFVSRYSAQYHHRCLNALPIEEGYHYLLVKHRDFDEPLFAGVFKFDELFFFGLKFKTIKFGFPLSTARPMVVKEPTGRDVGAAFMRRALKAALRWLGTRFGIRFLILPGIVQDGTASNQMLISIAAAFNGRPMWTISARGQNSLDSYFNLFNRKRRKRLRRIFSRFRSENLTFKISAIEEIDVNELVNPLRLTYEKRNGRCDINLQVYLHAVKETSSGTVKIAQICRGSHTLAFDMICHNKVSPLESEVSLTGYNYILGSGIPLYEALYLCEIQWLTEVDCPVRRLNVGQGCDLPKRRLGGQATETLTVVATPYRLLAGSLYCLSVITRLLRIRPSPAS